MIKKIKRRIKWMRMRTKYQAWECALCFPEFYGNDEEIDFPIF
jgi:hypothetical protein